MSKAKKVLKEIEEKSPQGFVIKVRLLRNSFIIFRPDGNPERLYPQDPNRILNPIKTIVFIGGNFIIQKPFVDLCFVPVKRNRIFIPYQHTQMKENKVIIIHTNTICDLMPMIVEKIDNLELLLESFKIGKKAHYIVIDESTNRSDILRIRQRTPKSFLFQIKIQAQAKIEEPKEQETEDAQQPKIRAMDIIGQAEKNLELYSDNPVFLARIFLRNMELAKMKSLLLEKPMTVQDNDFIQTLLDIMIRNDGEKEDLIKHRNEFLLLKSYCQTQKLILEGKLEEVRSICETEADKEKLNFYSYLIKRYKESAKNKDEEILYWEIGALIDKRIQELPDEKGRRRKQRSE